MAREDDDAKGDAIKASEFMDQSLLVLGRADALLLEGKDNAMDEAEVLYQEAWVLMMTAVQYMRDNPVKGVICMQANRYLERVSNLRAAGWVNLDQ